MYHQNKSYGWVLDRDPCLDKIWYQWWIDGWIQRSILHGLKTIENMLMKGYWHGKLKNSGLPFPRKLKQVGICFNSNLVTVVGIERHKHGTKPIVKCIRPWINICYEIINITNVRFKQQHMIITRI